MVNLKDFFYYHLSLLVIYFIFKLFIWCKFINAEKKDIMLLMRLQRLKEAPKKFSRSSSILIMVTFSGLYPCLSCLAKSHYIFSCENDNLKVQLIKTKLRKWVLKVSVCGIL